MASRFHRSRWTALVVTAACLAVVGAGASGCTKEEWRLFWEKDKDKQRQPDPAITPVSKSLATRGTISELVTVDGLRLLHVRGFGLVVDLAETGGSDGPEEVKKYIVKESQRRQRPGDPSVSPDDLFKGRDTALVEVTGLIPAGARRGETFDVVVRALGTQTKSLVGGRLVLCELKLYAETIDAVLGGKSLAGAGGPIFVSPIGLGKKPPEKINLRTGLVLGGGVVKKARTLRLVLNNPSPSVATRIVDRLNSRYAAAEPVAVAKSYSTIEITPPPKYRTRKTLFLEHVLHTMLNAAQEVLEARAKDLALEITHPDADLESIGLAWEAIGRIVLPHVQPLYQGATPAACYHAARTGMRLEDNAGLEVIMTHAQDAGSPYRLQAIEELAFAVDMHPAGECLRKLLSDSDDDIRLRAYRALRRRPHPAIESRVLYQDNLVLDVVDSAGPYMVYAHRSMVPRIAVFGKQMQCRPPAMYPAKRRDDRFLHMQISAEPDATALTLIYRNKRTGMISPPLTRTLNVAELVEFLGGDPVRKSEDEVEALGVPYSEIFDILYTFCDSGTIPGKFIPEDLTGKSSSTKVSREREESEY